MIKFSQNLIILRLRFDASLKYSMKNNLLKELFSISSNMSLHLIMLRDFKNMSISLIEMNRHFKRCIDEN